MQGDILKKIVHKEVYLFIVAVFHLLISTVERGNPPILAFI